MARGGWRHSPAKDDSDRSITVISDSEEERNARRAADRQVPRTSAVVYEEGRDIIVISDSEDEGKGLEQLRRRHSGTICGLDDDNDEDIVPSSQPDEIEVELEPPSRMRRQASVAIPRKSLDAKWEPPLTPSAFNHHTEATEILDSEDEGNFGHSAIIHFDNAKRRKPTSKVNSPPPQATAQRISSPKAAFLPPDVPHKPKTPRKKKADPMLERRMQLAYELYNDLNAHVFGDQLCNVTMRWNPRFLTTAGRAKWQKSAEGRHSSIVELSPKVIDSDERLRNTVGHELSHIASWQINNSPQEQHGALWTAWTDKVMRYRRDICISTRHEYEISCPYNWKCTSCTNKFGRHSKSINPEKVMCPCGGMLEAMFETKKSRKKQHAASSSSESRLASSTPQASPVRSPPSRGKANESTTSSFHLRRFGSSDGDFFGEDEDDVDALSNKLAATLLHSS
ncbi:SprT-like family-domain-containing protein [Auriculariales sp. MPI-PUGE-AT-0066]|nr:SprT-like family-domain-containing protein [Auriculariales sp. MPI-PUGE-AT-0066]